MLHYLENFFSGWHQLTALAAVLAVWAGFAAIAAVCGGRERSREADVLVGWGLVSLLFVAGGALFHLHFINMALPAGLAALICAVIVMRRGDVFYAGTLGRFLLLALPMLILVSGMRVSQWDEFTDWALIPRLLLETDAFPGHDNPFPAYSFIAYPYSWHFVSYLAGRLAGGFVESTGPLMNTLLLYGFGLVSIRMIATAYERPEWTLRPGWILLAIGALTATLLNPTFAQKVAMTSYADVPTAVCAGAAAVLGWQLLESLRSGAKGQSRSLVWQFGLVLMLLINMKQVTLVLFVLITVSVLLTGLRDRGVDKGDLLKAMAGSVIPSLLIYFLWRYYVSQELTTGEFSLRPFSEWFIDLIPEIVGTMLLILSKKGYFAVLLVAAVIFGIRGLWCARTPFDRFAGIVALTVLGYEAFLLLTYVASFGKGDALRAASFWRYNMHVGLIVVAFAVYGAALLWRRHVPARIEARLKWLPVVLVLLLPLVFAEKIRFDREPWVMHYRDTGADIVQYLEPGAQIFIFDPMGSGESGGITAYETLRKAKFTGYVSAFHKVDAENLRQALKRADGKYIVVHSVNAALAGVLGLPEKGGKSYLMRQDAQGTWRELAAWPHPEPGR